MKRTLRLMPWLTLGFVGILLVEVIVALRGDYLMDERFLIAKTVTPGAARAEVGNPQSIVGTEESPPFHLWVLGDSTAAGLGAADESSTLPVLLAGRVAAASGRSVKVTGLGVSGARTATVTTDQVPRLPTDEVDAVVVVVGANDVTHLTPPWAVTARTKEMLTAVVERTEAPVVLGGIPRFAGIDALLEPLRTVTDAYGAVLRRAQREAVADLSGGRSSGVTFVDIAAEASPRFLGVPEAMSTDGFHPSTVGYGFWADALAPPVTAIARGAG